MEYTKSDGLILVSLFGADKGSGATLSGTMGYAEMLTHSVPSAEHLSGALTRLVQAGLLEITSGRYVLCEAIREELTRSIGREGDWSELPDKAFAVLKARRDRPVNSCGVALTAAEVSAAWDEFLSAAPAHGFASH